MNFRFSALVPLILLSFVVSNTGCGAKSNAPPVGTVSGKVTLNGEPLKDATIEFIPAEGRPSMGQTNADGNYTLTYDSNTKGALIGQHTVRITTARARSGGEGDQPLVEARPEVVPAKYNDASTLTADVKAGANTFDFPLEGQRKQGGGA